MFTRPPEHTTRRVRTRGRDSTRHPLRCSNLTACGLLCGVPRLQRQRNEGWRGGLWRGRPCRDHADRRHWSVITGASSPERRHRTAITRSVITLGLPSLGRLLVGLHAARGMRAACGWTGSWYACRVWVDSLVGRAPLVWVSRCSCGLCTARVDLVPLVRVVHRRVCLAQLVWAHDRLERSTINERRG